MNQSIRSGWAGILVFLGLSFLLVSMQPLLAQTTTAGISGRILDAKGETIPGANVIVLHLPTGTKYGAATNAEGRYNLVNMNPGGPYEVTVSFIGFKNTKQDNVYLKLGEKLRLDIVMQDEATQLQEVQIVGKSEGIKTGSSTNVGKEQIQTLPTLSRSFSDFTRLTPQSSNNSFAGTNFRYNNITLDGAINNDAIGFSPSLGGISGTANQPGSSTRTNSFSLDAVQEVQVQIAPYDVSLGNFTGGSINAVSRSGTNDVTGSVYGFGRNATITGNYKGSDRVNGGKISNSYYDYQSGFRVGLPLIKNKLFLFTNEEVTHSQIPLFYPAGAPGYFMTTDIANQITQKLESLPSSEFNPNGGYNPGATTDYNIYSKSTKFFNRIDWNISDKHQLAIRNNSIISEASNLERASTQFQFGNYDFIQKNNNISTVAELKSRFNSQMSNSLIVGYTDIEDKRNPTGSIFPQIQINNVNGSGTVFIGTNREAGIFNMRQRTLEFTDNFKWFLGNHALTLGTHNELYTINYNFINSWNGRFDYNSVSDFLNDRPNRLRAIYNPNDNSRDYNLNNSPAKYNVDMWSVYAQDEWTVNDKLTLTYGLRGDMTTIPNGPPTTAHSQFPDNPANYGTTYTYNTPVSQVNNKYFGQVYVSPRFGFNYDAKGDGSVIVRGGSGLFTGRIPFAWLGYTYVNNGVSFDAYDIQPRGSRQMQIPTDPTQFAAYAQSAGAGRVELDLLDKNFSMPRMWRSNLAVDFKLGNGYKLTLEGIYTKTIKDVMIKQLNLKDSVFYAPYDVNHQQPLYLSGGNTANRVSNTFSSVYLITNTNQGYRYQLTAQIQKAYPFGLNVSAAYTYGQSKDILNGIRNSPESGWQTNQALNPNMPTLTYSNFDLRHRIVASANYKRIWNEHLTSYASLIFTAESGSPFTWVIGSNNLTNNGQQVDLAFIPANREQINLVDIKDAQGNVVRTADQQWQDLNSFISSDKYLDSRRGQFTQRNGGRTPWNNRLDLRLMQDFNFKVGAKTHTFQLSFDIINLTNLIDKHWGNVYFTPNTINSSVNTGLNVTRGPNNVLNYTFTRPAATYSIDQFSSRWQGQLGLRYLF